jgi:tetratricopeptide (TPR) repeat protein
MLPLEKAVCMRVTLVLFWLLLALDLQAATPEVGKEKLRRLVKLPSISFQPEWTFDPETGFKLGSKDNSAQIKTLRRELRDDPNNADSWLRLGKLYVDAGDAGNAFSARSKAAQLYRERVEGRPEDALLLSSFGEALAAIGNRKEAESVLRRAARSGSNEWKCWIALGRFLDAESRRALSENAGTAAEVDTLNRDASAAGLAVEGVTLARRRLAEAGDCFERAVTNAPSEAEPYLRRGLHRTLRSYLLNNIREASGERQTETEILSDYFSPESLADLQQASRLSPKDYRLIGTVVLFEVYGVNARTGRKDGSQGFDWATLPDACQRSLRASITRLEDLTQDPDAKVAGGASEVLGILQGPLLHETNSRLDNLRRALALDPSREPVWEMMAGTLARAERYDDLLSLCEARLKQKDSARSHMLLAKAHERLHQWDDAEDQVAEAVKQAPNDLTANLALAALLLKRSQDPDVLGEANGWLARCEQLIAALPAQQKSRQLIIDFTLTRSIYLALTDDLESARRWARTVIDSDKENEMAREILAAMEY